eukprot:1197138-Rhodomonas_salina.9
MGSARREELHRELQKADARLVGAPTSLPSSYAYPVLTRSKPTRVLSDARYELASDSEGWCRGDVQCPVLKQLQALRCAVLK